MLTFNRKNLIIFKNFVSNTELKKFKKSTFDNYRVGSIDLTEPNFDINDDSSGVSNIIFSSSGLSVPNSRFDEWEKVWDGLPFASKRVYKTKLEKYWYLTKIKCKSVFLKSKGSPIELFKSVKQNIEELNSIEEKIEFLNKVINKLRESGQIEMLNSALFQKRILEWEKILKDNNFKKFLTEENLIKFTLKCKRGLKLEYIKDFNRLIPESVVNNKNKADDLLIFDNFVILHFDADVKNIKLVSEEKKDPILFGVIKNSTKLYFIDDWIDENCNLTYSMIIKELNIDQELI